MASSTPGSRSVLRGLTAVHIFSSVYPVASEAYHNFGTLSRQLEMLLEDQKGALRPEFSFLKSRIGQLHIDISGTRPRFITHRHVPRTFLRSIERLVPIMANILRVADNLIEHNNEIVTQHVISVKDITARADFCSAVQEMFYFCTELVGRTLAGRNYRELVAKQEKIDDASLPASGTIPNDELANPDSAFLDPTQGLHLANRPNDLQYCLLHRQDEEAILLRHIFPGAVRAEMGLIMAVQDLDSFIRNHPEYKSPTVFPENQGVKERGSSTFAIIGEMVDRLKTESRKVDERSLHGRPHQRAAMKLTQVLSTRLLHAAKRRRDIATNRADALGAYLRITAHVNSSLEIERQLDSIDEPRIADREFHAKAVNRIDVLISGLTTAFARLLAAKSDLRREIDDFRCSLSDLEGYSRQSLNSLIRRCHTTIAGYSAEKTKTQVLALDGFDDQPRQYYFAYCAGEIDALEVIITVLQSIPELREQPQTPGAPAEKANKHCLSQCTGSMGDTIRTRYATVLAVEEEFVLALTAYDSHVEAHCSDSACPDTLKLEVALANAGKKLLSQQLNIIKQAPTSDDSPVHAEVLRIITAHLKSNHEKLSALGALDELRITSADDRGKVSKHHDRRGKPCKKSAVVEMIRQRQDEQNGDNAVQHLYVEDVAAVTVSLGGASPDLRHAYEELCSVMRPILLIIRETDRAIALATELDQQKAAPDRNRVAEVLQKSKERLVDSHATAKKCRAAVEMRVDILKAFAEGELETEIGHGVGAILDEKVLDTQVLRDVERLEKDLQTAGLL
jgi:hypothetical protein